MRMVKTPDRVRTGRWALGQTHCHPSPLVACIGHPGDPNPTRIPALPQRSGLRPDQYETAFQSRLGRDPWLKPYMQDRIDAFLEQGWKKVCAKPVCRRSVRLVCVRARLPVSLAVVGHADE